MNPQLSLPQQTHAFLNQYLQAGDIVIDATCGNGWDTLFLAQQVYPHGLVYAIDIQVAAIEATKKRLQLAAVDTETRYFQTGHEQLQTIIAPEHQNQIKAIMFNLGYLPRGNKKIITQTKTTLLALNSALNILLPAGYVTVLAYPGHLGGDIETVAVTTWALNLDPAIFELTVINSHQINAHAPKLFIVQKLVATG